MSLYKWCPYLFVIVLSEYTNTEPTEANKKIIPFPYYTRTTWGAVNATDRRPLRRPVPYVVIHHTFLPEACYTAVTCMRSMRKMQAYHIRLRWGDIGYNFCVGTEGGVYEGRGWNVVGIHAGAVNNYSIGICLIGDFRFLQPPDATLKTTKTLISIGVRKGIISPTYKLIGHNQVMQVKCPGRALHNLMSSWEHFWPRHIETGQVTGEVQAVTDVQLRLKIAQRRLQ